MKSYSSYSFVSSFNCLQFLVIINKTNGLPSQGVETLSTSIVYVEIHCKYPVFQSSNSIIHPYQQYVTVPRAHTVLLFDFSQCNGGTVVPALYGMTQQVCTTQMATTAAIYHLTQQGNMSTIIC